MFYKFLIMKRIFNNIGLVLIVPFILLNYSIVFSAQTGDNEVKEISNAIGKMDGGKLAGYFGTTIDLEINETNDNYSKTQAEVIIQDFFKTNPCLSFTLNHQGDSDNGAKYFIGTYKTAKKNFRVYGLLKKENDKLLIRQLQFDPE